MLVVISDLHLTDGSSGETISADAFRVFKDDMSLLIQQACYRADGEFEVIERCDLVLNGDVLDIIRSERWRDKASLKPWTDTASPEFIDIVEKITAKIIEQNTTAFGYLSELAAGVKVSDSKGQEHPTPVPVHIHFMVGNHDWFYHLDDPRLNACRNQLIEVMGLSNPADKPFPHRLEEAFHPQLQALCLQHRVYIQHGDLQDPINYVAEKGRDYSSIGDAVVVLLLNRYPELVRQRLGLELDAILFQQLKEIDNVRPLYMTPGWTYGVIKRYANKQQIKQTIQAWRDCIRELHAEPFVKQAKKYLSCGQRFQFWLQFGLCNWIPFSWFIWIARTSGKLLPKYQQTYLNAAMNESWLKPSAGGKSKADYVSYGHTHLEHYYPIEKTVEERRVVDKIYFNSGTWRVVHVKAERHPAKSEYNSHHVMTYLVFYKENERGGRPFETWSGRLGIDDDTLKPA